jgi:hypothetical protein
MPRADKEKKKVLPTITSMCTYNVGGRKVQTKKKRITAYNNKYVHI